MILPRFSIRWVMGLVTFCALLSVVVRAGYLGQAWAIGVAAAFAVLLLTVLVHAGVFFILWPSSQIFGRAARAREQNAMARPVVASVVVPGAESSDPDTAETS